MTTRKSETSFNVEGADTECETPVAAEAHDASVSNDGAGPASARLHGCLPEWPETGVYVYI